jgi:chromosome segregation ATPase
MLVRKRKEKLSKKKRINEETDSEENLQSVRSWIRKIEQTTASVSSRLSAVEKRLSGRMSEMNGGKTIGIEGPIETLFVHVKKKDTPEVVRILDSELCFLHNELTKQQQETSTIKEQLEKIEKTQTTMTTEFQGLQTAMTDLNTTMELQMNQKEKHEPFVMRLGSLEVPVEFTGIIGGLLAFLIAILVLIGQKEILLSPWFLIPVGLLLITFALVKMIRNRSHRELHPFLSLPLDTSSVQSTLTALERKEG